MITRFKKFGEKIVGYLKELGKLTPIAFLTAILPIIGGTILLIVALPLGHWLRTNWEIGAILFSFSATELIRFSSEIDSTLKQRMPTSRATPRETP